MSKKKKRPLNKKTKAPGKRKVPSKTRAGMVSDIISSALALYQQGDVRGAKRAFLSISRKNPLNTDALYNLGIIAKDRQNYDEAIDYYEKVISINPAYVNACFGLGGIFIDQARYDEANEKFQKVVSLSPNYANAWYNLGIIAATQGRRDEAIKYYQKALSIDPTFVNACYNIGLMLLEQKKYDEAIEYSQKVISLNPGYVDALFNIGSAMQNKNDYAGAIEYYEKALAIKPDYYLVHNNLGIIHQAQYNFDKAIEHYERAISIQPETADAYMNMGNVFRNSGDVQKTVEYYKKSISLKPSLVGLNNLCGYQKELCNYEEVLDLSGKILEYNDLDKADLAGIHDTCIQTCEWEKASGIIERFRKTEMNPAARDVLAGSFMEFCAITDLSLDEISEQHKKWGELTEREAEPFEHDKRESTGTERKKLRIGYSSPDLREHSVGYLIKDIIKSHNHDEFEIYCYANFFEKEKDAFTREIINSGAVFKYVKHLPDREVAEEIYKDEINILIDLAGHTAGHRLRAFAYKPAPIQITYLGYPNTTGLSRMDYRLTDCYAESGRENDYRYSEKLIRLTNCFLSFNGFGDVVPALIKGHRRGGIIFGCFNNIQKLTPKAVELWSKILKEVEGSELHLKAKQLNTEFIWDNIMKKFAKYGISEERVKCLGYTATREEHLRLYGSMDISLDTFPYNGTVTTLEALWMNIPVITLVGESHAQRVSYSILKNLNLDQLIAFTEEEYVSKSIELAENPEIIRGLKTKMRKNLLASSICNPRVITREMELNFKRIWMEYQESGIRGQGSEVREQKSGVRSHPGEMRPAVVNEFHRAGRAGDTVGDAISAASRLRMAMVKLEKGEYGQAIEISSSLVDENGVSYLACYILGVSHFRLGREKDAIEALNKSLSLNNSNPGVWKALGEIYLSMGEIDEANACLERIAAPHNM
ncbi:MAG: protein O-GlcNAc transferase [Desulfobacteraceae bacterium Eth-SRB1]|nr:MAG: protein O-GlcNAc transferase [Desulfobacteraceae bacterium Eth-SRB1]